MDAALGWIGQIFQWLAQWIPRWLVLSATEGGVKYEGFFLPPFLRKFKGDIRITKLGPGLVWYWPATSKLDTSSVVFQVDHLPAQSFETSDGVPITVGGIVSYRVTDIEKLLVGAHSPYHVVQLAAMNAIHDVISKMTVDTLKAEQAKGTLKTKLRNAVQKDVTEFGVKIEECSLTDMTKARALRLIQSTPLE